jgi:hypothetical protein
VHQITESAATVFTGRWPCIFLGFSESQKSFIGLYSCPLIHTASLKTATQRVRTILYTAGLSMRRRRGTQIGCRRVGAAGNILRPRLMLLGMRRLLLTIGFPLWATGAWHVVASCPERLKASEIREFPVPLRVTTIKDLRP